MWQTVPRQGQGPERGGAVWVACPVSLRLDLPAPPGAQLQAWVAASACRGRGVLRPRLLIPSAPASHAVRAQYILIIYEGKESEKIDICICKMESLFCKLETSMTL